ncbi:MAG: hypothetical protein K2X87_16925 [Gemmataceae bacterium]|nr:hypothetical protein [Gemmataceae bacterium]
MTRRTQSLLYPSDPLASLRALQDLDAPKPAPERDLVTDPQPPPPPPSAENESLSDGGSEDGRVTGSAGGTGPVARRPRMTDPKREKAASDPMVEAVRRLLATPYGETGGRGAVTVSTVKIPTEVWERLGWVAKLSGRTKQDIITDALKRYFETVLKG